MAILTFDDDGNPTFDDRVDQYAPLPDDWEDDGKKPEVDPKWTPNVNTPVPRVRCTVFRGDGSRCINWSVAGTSTCIQHGGVAEAKTEDAQARIESARERLLGLMDKAIDTMDDLLDNGNDVVRAKIADSVLDRTAGKAAIEIKVETTQSESAADRALRILAAQAERLNQAPEPVEIEAFEVIEHKD